MHRICIGTILVLIALTTFAQQPGVAVEVAADRVPHLVKFSGTVAAGQGAVGLTFALYAHETGGAPLWLETQNVTVDQNGRYTIFLGANHAGGVPAELFASGEARWLGVQPEGQAEQARVLLVSVPYALKAADADTLGGKPLSAFMLAPSATSSTTSTSGAYVNTAAVTAAAYAISGTAGALALFTSSSDLTGANVYQSGENIGIGTGTPQRALHIKSATPVIKLEDTGFPNGWWELQQSAFVNETFGFLRYENPGGAIESKSFVLTKDGNMGIGTGTPSRKLHLKTAGQTVIRLEDSNYPNSFWELQDAAFCDDCFGFLRYESGSAVPSKSLLISAGGNFGVGTAYPTAKLEVAGDIKFSGSLMGAGGTGTTGFSTTINNAAGTAGIFDNQNASGKILSGLSNGTEKFSVSASGNGYFANAVGINTTNPQFPLDVARAVGSVTTAKFGVEMPLYLMQWNPMVGFNNYYNGGFKYGVSGYAAGYIAFGQNITNGFSFATAPTNAGAAGAAATMTTRMVISNDGKVGIGTTAPSEVLQVSGNILSSGNITAATTVSGATVAGATVNVDSGNANAGGMLPGLVFGSASGEGINSRRTAGTNQYGLDFTTNSTNRMSITNGGSVGIGTQAPGATLDVRGDIKLGSTGALYAEAGEEKLRTIRGRVDSSGGISSGSGFTVTKNGTGDYSVTFTTQYSASVPYPAVVVTPNTTSLAFAIVRFISGPYFQVYTYNSAGVQTDESFLFIATGPR